MDKQQILNKLGNSVKQREDFSDKQKNNLLNLLPFFSNNGLLLIANELDVNIDFKPPIIKKKEPKLAEKEIDYTSFANYGGFSKQLIKDIEDFATAEKNPKNEKEEISKTKELNIKERETVSKQPEKKENITPKPPQPPVKSKEMTNEKNKSIDNDLLKKEQEEFNKNQQEGSGLNSILGKPEETPPKFSNPLTENPQHVNDLLEKMKIKSEAGISIESDEAQRIIELLKEKKRKS